MGAVLNVRILSKSVMTSIVVIWCIKGYTLQHVSSLNSKPLCMNSTGNVTAQLGNSTLAGLVPVGRVQCAAVLTRCGHTIEYMGAISRAVIATIPLTTQSVSVPSGNADRHHYETYAKTSKPGRMVHVDNGQTLV